MRMVCLVRYFVMETLILIGNWSILVSFLIPFVISVVMVICALQLYVLSGKIEEISSWQIVAIMFGSIYIPIQSAVFNKVLYEWNSGILAQKWMYGISRFTIVLIDNIVDSMIFIILLTCIVAFGIVPSISVLSILISITILVPPIIVTTRLYAMLLTKSTISSIVGVVALVPILPSLTISTNILSNQYLVWHDIGIGIAYCVFCIVAYSLVSWLISIYVEIIA